MRHDRVPFAVDITMASRVVRTRRGGRWRPFVPVAGPARRFAARERAFVGAVYLSAAANAAHALASNWRVTPSRSAVSRTVTPLADAISTHCPPLLPL